MLYFPAELKFYDGKDTIPIIRYLLRIHSMLDIWDTVATCMCKIICLLCPTLHPNIKNILFLSDKRYLRQKILVGISFHSLHIHEAGQLLYNVNMISQKMESEWSRRQLLETASCLGQIRQCQWWNTVGESFEYYLSSPMVETRKILSLSSYSQHVSKYSEHESQWS